MGLIDGFIGRVEDLHGGETHRVDDFEHGSKKLARANVIEGSPLDIGSQMRGVPMRNRERRPPLSYFPSGLDLHRPVLRGRIDKIGDLLYRPF
jgi:hypothetical protein